MGKFLGLNIFTNKGLEKRDKDAAAQGYNPFSNALFFGNQGAITHPAMSLSAVYRATELISDGLAMLPIYITDEEHNELTGHPLNHVFSDGMGYLSKNLFIKMLVQSVLLRGNGYAYIYRDASGNPVSLRYLEEGEITCVYNKYKQELYYNAANVKAGRIPPEDVIHIVKNSWNGVQGVSVLSYAKRTLGIAHNTEDSANSFFSNGCNLAGIITVQGNLTEKQKQDIRTSWSQAYNGTQTNGCLLGVMQGNMSYQPIQVNAEDAQMLESRIFNIQDIARFFGISPIMLGDYSQGNSYRSMEAIQQQFLLHTLQPYIDIFEAEFTRKLCKDNIRINFDESTLLKNDKNAQATYFGTLVDKGILSINEVREELGYASIEGGDKHIIAYTDINQNTINDAQKNPEKKEDTEEKDNGNKFDSQGNII